MPETSRGASHAGAASPGRGVSAFKPVWKVLIIYLVGAAVRQSVGWCAAVVRQLMCHGPAGDTSGACRSHRLLVRRLLDRKGVLAHGVPDEELAISRTQDTDRTQSVGPASPQRWWKVRLHCELGHLLLDAPSMALEQNPVAPSHRPRRMELVP